MATFVQYLTLSDYYASIQKNQLESQILDSLNIGNSQRFFAESWAIGKVRGSLKSRYDLDLEFTPTLPYSFTETYSGGSRVIIDFDDWVQTHEEGYKTGDCVIKDNNGYIALNDIPYNTAWNESLWNGIGKKYSIWHIAYPYPVFSMDIKLPRGINVSGYYKIGDLVYWNNKVYRARQDTTVADHVTVIQHNSYSDVGYSNVFPDDPVLGTSQWEYVEDFSVAPNSYPYLPQEGGEPSAWTLGDNRDIVMVKALLDLSIWMLHHRISPMNIPKMREDNKNFTFAWLRSLKDGSEESDVPLIQPSQGNSLDWGSKPKNINGYGDW